MTTTARFEAVEGGVRRVLVVEATREEMLGGAMRGWASTLDKLAHHLD